MHPWKIKNRKKQKKQKKQRNCSISVTFLRRMLGEICQTDRTINHLQMSHQLMESIILNMRVEQKVHIRKMVGMHLFIFSEWQGNL